MQNHDSIAIIHNLLFRCATSVTVSKQDATMIEFSSCNHLNPSIGQSVVPLGRLGQISNRVPDLMIQALLVPVFFPLDISESRFRRNIILAPPVRML